jgi:class 3 adenylate cyclase
MLLLVGLASWLGWWGARQITSELVDEKRHAVIELVESQIRAHLHRIQQQVLGIGRLISDGRLRPEDKAAIGETLVATLAVHPELSASRFVYADGTIVRAFRDSDGTLKWQLQDGPPGPLGPQRRNEQLGIAWGEIFYSPILQDAVINVQLPIHRDGQYLGVIGAGITARQLSEIVASLGRTSRLSAFVLLGPDRILAHPRLAGGGFAWKRDELPPLSAVGDPILANLSKGSPIGQAFKGTDAAFDTVRVTTDESTYIVITKILADFGATPWRIGVAGSNDLFLSSLGVLRRLGLVALLLPIIAALSALVLARALVAAITRVTTVATQIATLELEAIGPIPSSRIRELDAQANAFNAMITALRAFETYVPKRLVSQLIRSGGTGRLAYRERDLAVMFTDISGFTAMSESMPAADVAATLNGHFTLLAKCIDGEGGTIDKYMGDGLMAFWGAPERIKERAKHACRAALSIRRSIANDNNRRVRSGEAPVILRIGVHRGPLVVGNIGAPGRVNYTVVGDTVNVAQRLLEAARAAAVVDGVAIVVSGPVVEHTGDEFEFVRIGSVAMKGRVQQVDVYELRGLRSGSAARLPVSA